MVRVTVVGRRSGKGVGFFLMVNALLGIGTSKLRIFGVIMEAV